ncbi:hypothetical protein FDJ28_gp12 [Pseudomonas phage Bjorn]|uniref:Tail fiber protein n=1 Tax=Pseudomonas phage Bjorn TaxID=2079288 RepID=A0A2K9VHJ8_9CAUD|nr:hypothetical protein FDJ28_gp12 [Pseudomonas phage Bjorn]AUV61758.1 hypothetical protein PsPhBjorn_gp58 [Pseudomonas phage Bjorn]
MAKYNPTVPPTKENELLPFLDDEFVRIGQSLNDVEAGFWGVSENAPEKLRPGLVKFFAAGVVGVNEGLYTYGTDDVWRYGGTVPDPKPLPGAWTVLPAALNGSAPAGNCAYRINTDKDALILTFFLTGGTISTTTKIYTLPVGARPDIDVPFPLYTQTPLIGTTLTFPPPNNPGANQYDQIINILTRATAATAISPAAYCLVKTNGDVEVTFVPNNGTLFGGTFNVPLPVSP